MNKRIYIVLFLLSLFTQSCIRDDLSNCPQGKYIWFESLNPKYVYKNIVNRVDISLYDEQGQLCQELTYLSDELAVSQAKVHIPDQKKGAYTIVALVNLSDSYTIHDKEQLETWALSFFDINNNKVLVKPPDIYHAMKTISFCTDNYQAADTLHLEKTQIILNLPLPAMIPEDWKIYNPL